MNILISIEHPAWAHQFKEIISVLKKDGHNVYVLAIDKDGTIDLLNSFNINYTKVGSGTGNNFFDKLYLFVKLSLKYTYIARKNKVDIFIGRSSPMMAIASFFTRKKHLIFEDTEIAKLSLFICNLFTHKIVTPINFNVSVGKKHIPLNTYKELFYLHPDCFTPNIDKLLPFGINPESKYFVLRFVSHKASHDFGKHGFSDDEKVALTNAMLEKGSVYISSEDPLPKELDQYKIKLPYENIHHLIYYATMLVGDSATMASEAAVLGTHAIYRFSVNASTIQEQEEKYKLTKFFKVPEVSFEVVLNTINDMLKDTELFNHGKIKREFLLQDKKSINSYFIKMIENNNID